MEDEDVPVCWICNEELGNERFRACGCTGELENVHRSCLSTWLTISRNTACQICGVVYNTRVVWRPLREMTLLPRLTYQEGLELIVFIFIMTLGAAGLAAATWVWLYIVGGHDPEIDHVAAAAYYVFFVFYQLFVVFGLGAFFHMMRHVGRAYAAVNTRVEVFPYRPRPTSPECAVEEIELQEILPRGDNQDEEGPAGAAPGDQDGPADGAPVHRDSEESVDEAAGYKEAGEPTHNDGRDDNVEPTAVGCDCNNLGAERYRATYCGGYVGAQSGDGAYSVSCHNKAGPSSLVDILPQGLLGGGYGSMGVIRKRSAVSSALMFH
ncbi:K3 [Human gammaherpesvirus 8]|uniref:K3 n=1 Tax=Human herpesvirus 8 TaxID=37296 RepID=UPI000069A30E|nr:K3 [Human gammaherpesvirus 8]ABD28858.1 K3 [Human gammaherpesvirus 8]ULE29418.1 K3 [Human gammaherpesvirus 8]